MGAQTLRKYIPKSVIYTQVTILEQGWAGYDLRKVWIFLLLFFSEIAF